MTAFHVDRLFRVSKEVEVGGNKIVVRALSEVQRNAAHVHAAAASARLRQALLDPNSDQHAANFMFVDQLTDEQIRSSLSVMHVREENVQAQERFPYEYLPIPEGAKLDEEREVILAREEMRKKLDAQRAEFVKEAGRKYEESLKGREHPWLLAQLKAMTIQALADTEYSYRYISFQLYEAVYQLDGTRYFGSVEEALNVTDSVREALAGHVVEVNEIDPLRLSGQSTTG